MGISSEGRPEYPHYLNGAYLLLQLRDPTRDDNPRSFVSDLGFWLSPGSLHLNPGTRQFWRGRDLCVKPEERKLNPNLSRFKLCHHRPQARQRRCSWPWENPLENSQHPPFYRSLESPHLLALVWFFDCGWGEAEKVVSKVSIQPNMGVNRAQCPLGPPRDNKPSKKLNFIDSPQQERKT